jgi:hypothetical protein
MLQFLRTRFRLLAFRGHGLRLFSQASLAKMDFRLVLFPLGQRMRCQQPLLILK